MLAPTIAAAVAVRPADLGARYLRRDDRRHAKAGNLNHALEVIDADVVGVLDADHVPRPDFLTATLGYFDDPLVALVQTPQDFYNLRSFEHSRTASRDGFNEQSLFYRAILAGKNRWKAAFWCGTNALLRVSALKDVGGVATGTVTEDIHTTILLHAKGWRTAYHNEVLARGLAAASAGQDLLQRHRWGTGAMQVLRTDNPLTVKGLSVAQRLAYAFTLFGWSTPGARSATCCCPSRCCSPARSRSALRSTRSPSPSSPPSRCSSSPSGCSVGAGSGPGWRSCSTWCGCRPTWPPR